jgi:hypothetical protein
MSDVEPIWNVRLTVVELVPAKTAKEAIEKVRTLVERTGVEMFDDSGSEPDAFESEPLGDDVEAHVREEWRRSGPLCRVCQGRGTTR